ncbi:NlpC/P60 family protein [Candidatus Desulfosporosinus infrequens]|uniref:NlpC/P60 family protein n=1 Tax=Candidatus Desulfosporosinus infrequens TaxID=2043169 RepID=A0A2U3KD03_9FIRM|nr:NlpC/P60 family protein [Candidatus Desulfosporosinus infrequens]
MTKLPYSLLSLLVIFLICTYVKPVYAVNLQNNLHGYQSQLSTLKQQAVSQTQKESASVQQAQSIQTSINLLQATVEQDNVLIRQHQTDILDLKGQEEKLIAVRQQEIQTLGDYLRTEYEQGDSTYLNQLSWLLSSKTLDDLLTRITYSGSIVDSYKNLGDQINIQAKELQKTLQADQTATALLAQTVQSKQQMMDNLNLALTKQKDLITTLSTAEQQTLIAQRQVQKNIDDTQHLIAAQEREAALAAQEKSKQEQAASEKADQVIGKLTAPVKSNGTIGQLLAFAESFLGSPYVWGGTTPNPGFDCSGLVQYVYSHFGVNLNRVTWDQYQEGQSVAEADLKPGDLVFFSTYAPGASHIGIYVGNRMMLDDSDYGVAYDSLDHPYWAARYLGARRVIAQ